MKTLGKEVCSRWLRDLSIPEDPYHFLACPTAFVDQVSLPAQPWRKRSVIRQLFSACRPYESALLQFTDWVPFEDAMAILGGVRAQHGDEQLLIETPGHVVSPAEHELMVGMFAVAMFYGFTAYLYFSHGTIVLGWEGEMLDIWTSDEKRFSEAQRVFSDHELVHPPADA